MSISSIFSHIQSDRHKIRASLAGLVAQLLAVVPLSSVGPLGGRIRIPEATATKATILVADDNQANLELLSGILEGAGYGVVCVSDGRQALQAVRSGQVDMALLDVMMPGQSGLAACLEIKSSPDTRLFPVVLVTALTGTDDRVQGILCGADDFLNKPVKKYELLARVQSLLRIREFTNELENAEAVLFSLALSIEAKDAYTEGHCDRLSKYAVALAKRLRLPEGMQGALRRAGIVHDIGKVGVPDGILMKPGPLTPEEWKIMKQHPVVGERICAPLKSFRMALPAIRHHHEKLDGSGYPDGLRGQQIPLIARVLEIVDIYDALTTRRPYRDALSPEEAFRVMREEARRGWWDGALMDEFEGVLPALAAFELAKSDT
jgi:putative two-component system response regulator